MAVARLAAQNVEVSVNIGNIGKWSSPASWVPSLVPSDTAAARYAVVWNTHPGVLTLDGTYTVTSLLWTSGGTLAANTSGGTGSARLTVMGPLQWSHGVLDNAIVTSKGALHWVGSGSRQILGGSLAIDGAARLDDLSVQLSGGAILTIGGSLDLADGTAIVGDAPGISGGGRIQNFGMLGHLKGSGAAGIGNGIFVENFGNFRVASGSLSVGSFLQSAGVFEIVQGAALSTPGRIQLNGGLWVGEGTVQGPVDARCRIEPGGSGAVGRIAAKSLVLGTDAVLAVDVKDAQVADGVDVGQSIQLGGTLRVRLSPRAAALLAPDVQMSVMSGETISGSFKNVPPGGRISTVGNEGTFRVDYAGSNQTDPSRVWLGDFRPNPEGSIPLLKLPYLMVYDRAVEVPELNGTVWLAMADGSLDVKLTDGVAPRLSPDRKAVAFLRTAGTNVVGRDLWLKNLAAGSEDIRVQADPGYGPVTGIDFDGPGFGLLVGYECHLDYVPFAGDQIRLYEPSVCPIGNIARNPSGGLALFSLAGVGILGLGETPQFIPGSLPDDANRPRNFLSVISAGIRS